MQHAALQARPAAVVVGTAAVVGTTVGGTLDHNGGAHVVCICHPPCIIAALPSGREAFVQASACVCMYVREETRPALVKAVIQLWLV
jgi:hypothetical protein